MQSKENVEMLVVLQPIRVNTGSPDEEARLVIANGLLVAILVRLDDVAHDNEGQWFLEVAFGNLRELRAPTFDNLADATRWIRNGLRADLTE